MCALWSLLEVLEIEVQKSVVVLYYDPEKYHVWAEDDYLLAKEQFL